MLNPPRISRTALPLLAAVLLTGCTALEWHKTGASTDQQDQDFSECTLRARVDARQHAAPATVTPTITTDRIGRAMVSNPGGHDSTRFALEQDLIRECMTERGYVLREKTDSRD